MSFQDILDSLRSSKMNEEEAEKKVKEILEQTLSEKGANQYDIDSLTDRIMCVLCELAEQFMSSAPFVQDKIYNESVNKIKHASKDRKQCFDHISLADSDNIVDLGWVWAHGKTVSFAVDMNSKEVKKSKNLLLTIEHSVHDRAVVEYGIANYCFPDNNDVLFSEKDENRRYTSFETAGENTLDNLIPTGRFDPFHAVDSDHPNNFNVYLGINPKHDLFVKYFKKDSPTPHLHFYTEEICCGRRLSRDNKERTYRGNSQSLAINLGDLATYLNDVCDALEKGDKTADILKEENSLGMPYLKKLLTPGFKYDASAFNKKKKSIFSQKSLTARIGLQFFAQPGDYSHIRELAKAFKFINDKKAKLSAEEQISLLSAIEEGLGGAKTTYNEVEIDSYKKLNENEDDFYGDEGKSLVEKPIENKGKEKKRNRKRKSTKTEPEDDIDENDDEFVLE